MAEVIRRARVPQGLSLAVDKIHDCIIVSRDNSEDVSAITRSYIDDHDGKIDSLLRELSK